jgi:cell wall-associated NlpC family hydrolase
MNKNTTEPNSGHKRPNVFIHYITAALMLLMASSTTQATSTAAYAAAPTKTGGITHPASVLSEPKTSANPLDALIGTAQTTLTEYSLKIQLASVKDELAATDARVDAKIAEIDAEFEKYENVDALITKLHKYVGKAPYVFSGIGPTGWDCSGLTSWFYRQYKGAYLEHRASTQAEGGTEVDAPIPGDIVAFTYNGSKSAYHVAIYVGGGYMIHAKNQREDTVLETVKGFAKKTSKVAYIRY